MHKNTQSVYIFALDQRRTSNNGTENKKTNDDA